MKHRSNLLMLVALLFATATVASANIAPPIDASKAPRKTTGAPVRMHIRPDSKATEARLVIPRSVLQQLKAELDGEDSQTVAAVSGFNPSPTQTAVAGLFLSLSLVTGGLWFAGSRAKGGRASGVASALAFVAAGGAACATAIYAGAPVHANAGPPPVARSLTSKILIPDLSYWGASGAVKVEVAADDSQITLVLPKSKEATPAGE